MKNCGKCTIVCNGYAPPTIQYMFIYHPNICRRGPQIFKTVGP